MNIKDLVNTSWKSKLEPSKVGTVIASYVRHDGEVCVMMNDKQVIPYNVIRGTYEPVIDK
jgi:hypothetical protein